MQAHFALRLGRSALRSSVLGPWDTLSRSFGLAALSRGIGVRLSIHGHRFACLSATWRHLPTSSEGEMRAAAGVVPRVLCGQGFWRRFARSHPSVTVRGLLWRADVALLRSSVWGLAIPIPIPAIADRCWQELPGRRAGRRSAIMAGGPRAAAAPRPADHHACADR